MAVRIDASGDYLERTSVAVPFTVYGWAQLVTDRDDYSTIYSIDGSTVGSSSGYAFALETDSDGTTLGLYNGSAFAGSRSLSAGTWFFFAISVAADGTAATWYHAGLSDASLYSQATTLATGCNNYNHHVGNNSYSEWANCRVHGLHIADSALSSAELEIARQRQRPDRAMYLWSPLFNDATDYSGNGRNWTAGGSLTYEDGPPVSWGARPWVLPVVAASGTTYNQSADGTLTTAGAMVRQANKTVAGSLTTAGAILRSTAKTVAGSLTTAGTVVKQTAKTMAGTLTTAGTLASVRTYLASLSGSLTTAGTLTRSTGKTVAGTLTTAGAILRSTAKSLAGTLGTAGALVADFILGGPTYTQAVGGTLTTAGALIRSTSKSLAGSLATAGAITRQIARSLTGTLTTAGTLLREWFSPSAAKLDVTLTDALTYTCTLTDARVYTCTLADALTYTVTLGDSTV